LVAALHSVMSPEVNVLTIEEPVEYLIRGARQLKISENIEKITLPGTKKIFRYFNEDGSFYGDAILLKDEMEIERFHHPTFPAKQSIVKDHRYEKILTKVIDKGNQTFEIPLVQEIAAYKKQRFKLLQPEYKRFDNPHIYKVGISTRLLKTRDNLMNKLKN